MDSLPLVIAETTFFYWLYILGNFCILGIVLFVGRALREVRNMELEVMFQNLGIDDIEQGQTFNSSK